MLGMFGNSLEEQKFYNDKMCLDVSLEKIKLCRSYCIGNTDEENGKLTVYIDQNYRARTPPIKPMGESMFLLKGILPDNTIKCNPKVRKALEKLKKKLITGDGVSLHIMLLVKENKLSEFEEKVHDILQTKKSNVTIDVSKYGVIKVCYLPDLDKNNFFDLRYALENVSDVKADFIHENTKTKKSCGNVFSRLTTKSLRNKGDYKQL